MTISVFEEPASYSPSSLSQFTSCPLAFRFSYVDRIPQPPQIAATKGSMVHRALELLMIRAPHERTKASALEDLEVAKHEYLIHRDFVELELNDDQKEKFYKECNNLVLKYFELEDPTKIRPIGLELKLEAQIGDTLIRGIIDRLELDEYGELVVTDYKTGVAPKANYEQSKLNGVHIYSLLCEKAFGKIPSKVQLLYLATPAAILATPTQSTLKGVESKSNAIHKAIKVACDNGDFRPKESVLCNWCGYQKLCPAKGGTLPS